MSSSIPPIMPPAIFPASLPLPTAAEDILKLYRKLNSFSFRTHQPSNNRSLASWDSTQDRVTYTRFISANYFNGSLVSQSDCLSTCLLPLHITSLTCLHNAHNLRQGVNLTINTGSQLQSKSPCGTCTLRLCTVHTA